MAIYGLMIEALLPVKFGADTEPDAVVVPPLIDADVEKLWVWPEPLPVVAVEPTLGVPDVPCKAVSDEPIPPTLPLLICGKVITPNAFVVALVLCIIKWEWLGICAVVSAVEPVVPEIEIEPETPLDEPENDGADTEPDGVTVAEPPVEPKVEYVEPLPIANLSCKLGK